MALTRLNSDTLSTNAVTDTALNSTGVTAGTYGDSSHIPSFTVNEDGRLTSASDSPITNLVVTTLETTGDLTVGGNIIITGDTITLQTENLLIEDNIVTLTLNASAGGQPMVNAGLEINRGVSPTVGIRWNETIDNWELTTDGSNYYEILTNNSNSSISSGQLPTITSLGTVDTGEWQATNIGIPYGGTGASTAQAARTNLGIDDMTLDGGTY
jgi:hypothetical protein